MSEALVILAVGLLFAAFALLHRKAEAPSCKTTEAEGCEGCAHSTDCTEH